METSPTKVSKALFEGNRDVLGGGHYNSCPTERQNLMHIMVEGGGAAGPMFTPPYSPAAALMQ